MIPYLLVLVGLLMIFFEFFLPGGIMGMAGGLLMAVGIVLFAIQTNSAWMAIVFAVVAVGLLVGLARFALWRIKTGRGSKGIYLSTDQEGYMASEFAKEYIDKSGEALSDLKPSGHILVEGKRIQAVSKVGYIHKGSKIKVVGGEGAQLIVKQKDEE